MFGLRWCVVERLLVAVVLSLLFSSSCGKTGESSNVEADARFRELFRSMSAEGLAIRTSRATYGPDDIIDFWVENRTHEDLWFQDQSFGVRAFAYDEVARDWVEVDLGFQVSEPRVMSMESGGGGVVSYYDLWVERIDLPEDGKIRLVITGHTDLTNPSLDQVYVGYADIEVVE